MRCSGVVTERRYINESLGKTQWEIKRESQRDAHEVSCSCFIVLVGGVTTRGSHGPAVRLTTDTKACGY